jgi:SAM-dependent methyltransferase
MAPSSDVGNNGERISPDRTWSHFAHLSIYRFALSHAAGARVLDAGCGTGYGSSYLLSAKPATIDACDASDVAIAYCEAHYGRSPIRFSVVDLCKPWPYSDHAFDLVFSSNAMEHLIEIDLFLEECLRVLAPRGVLVAAVPPIVSPAALRANLENTFHVTNLTPLGWATKIGRFFQQVDCHLHRGIGKWARYDEAMAEIARSPAHVTIRETDFEFPQTTAEEMTRTGDNITAVFVARAPRTSALPPSLDETLPPHWHVGAIVADLIRTRDETIAARDQELTRLSGDASSRVAHRGRIDSAGRRLWRGLFRT